MVFKLTALIIATSFLIALAPTTSLHADEFDSGYYTIASTQTREIPTTQTKSMAPSTPLSLPAPSDSGTLGGILGGVLSALPGGLNISTIINIGEQIWNIVQANAPVANVTLNSASAVPQGVTQWQQLAGWQAPQVRTYETSWDNLYGMTVVDFQYRISYIPGGTYDGQGQYLADVTVQPQNLTVAWGYKFNAQVTIPSITNAGTVESPVAAAEVLVGWTVSTILKDQQQSAEYYVRGDGQFQALGTSSGS